MSLSKTQKLLIYLTLSSAVIYIYSKTASFDFAFDDVLQITLNSLVTSNPSNSGLLTPFFSPTPPGNLFRPLPLLTYKLNFLASGLNPAAYHITNIVLFLVFSFLLYHFFSAWFKKWLLALAATLLFICHPLATEVVANIIGRAELLAAIFGLLCCLSLRLAYKQKSNFIFVLLCCLSAVALMLATLSKESAYTFFFLAPLFALIYQGPTRIQKVRNITVSTLFLVLACLGTLSLRYLALGNDFIIHPDQRVWIENPLFHLPFNQRLIPALKILGDYLILFFLPLTQSADYSQTPNQILASTYSLAGTISLIALAALLATIYLGRKTSLAFGGLWFLIAFALTSNILTPIGTLMGERLAFTPNIGICGLVVGLLALAVKNSSALKLTTTSIFAALLLTLAIKSYYRVFVWQNNTILFNQTVKDAPFSPKAKYIYAVELYTNQQNYAEVEKQLRQALAIHPQYILAMRLLADTLLQRQAYGPMEYWYRRILEIDPNDNETRSNLKKLEQAKQKQLS